MAFELFVVVALAALAGLFLALRGRGDSVGWWIGLAHGGLALAALAMMMSARDVGFAVFAALLLVYAGAMCAAEAIHLAGGRTRT